MYAKIYDRIVESSLMETPIEVRYTFVFLLAIADLTGHVIGTDIAIARRLNMPLEEFQKCIAVLDSPDPDSNSQECDGRRVVPSEVERGYRIVNYETYRDIRDAEERRAYMREYMRKRRAAVNGVNLSEQELAELAHAEEEADAAEEAEAPAKKRANRSPKLTDEQWLESLKANPAYSSLDLNVEFGKCKAWCDLKGVKTISRQRLLNWFNKAIEFKQGVTLPAAIVTPKDEPVEASREEIEKYIKSKADLGWIKNSVASEVWNFVTWCHSKGIVPTIEYIEAKCDKSRWNIYGARYKMGPNGVPVPHVAKDHPDEQVVLDH